uniref:DnaJ subfamily C member 9 n=1 Tax=Aceria tosichella TaxID=561515 RepID=A0A6G1SA59_9ACAR
MTLLGEIEEYFDAKDLYQVLGIDKNATSDQIKKAYRKASLKVHPDRVGEKLKEKATKRFQVLSKVHYVLSDEERRRMYDDHGVIDSEGNLETGTDWLDYWRLLFPKVTVKDVDSFFDRYIGSEEEEKDLISIYNKYEGDLDKISDSHIGYDEERTVKDLERLIEAGKIEKFDKFVNEPAAKKAKRLRLYKREAKEAAKIKSAESKSKSSFDELSALVQQKNTRNFDDLISGLEAKYSKKPSERGTKRKRANR